MEINSSVNFSVVMYLFMFAVAFMGITYILERRQFGENFANNHLSRIFLKTTIYILLLLAFWVPALLGQYTAVFYIFCSIVLISFFFLIDALSRRSKQNLLLLESAEKPQWPLFLPLFFFCIIALRNFLIAYSDPNDKDIAANLFGTFLAIVGLTVNLWWGVFEWKIKKSVNEQGIYLVTSFIRWEQIDVYEWYKPEGEDRHVLSLTIDSPIPILREKLLVITNQQKEAVNDILNKYLPGKMRQS